MKFNSKVGAYHAANVYFHPEKLVATSYDWWTFVALAAGQITRKPGEILVSEMLWSDEDALFDYDR